MADLASCHCYLVRLPARVLLSFISAYKVIGSPWLGGRCRFVPSCSSYAAEAVQRHGAVKGGWLSARRLARCHPLSRGGLDQVPLSKVSPRGWR